MRVLITIPHFANVGGSGVQEAFYGSDSASGEPRLAALMACLESLRHTFLRPVCVIDHAARSTRPANQALTLNLTVVICTTGPWHLLDQVPSSTLPFEHCPTSSPPRLLGFECHEVLRQRLGAYDYYVYLEDDLCLWDTWFFHKLSWFSGSVGADKVLQPHRYEVGVHPFVQRVYLDGDLPGTATAPYQDITDTSQVVGLTLGQRISFERTRNPHAGCFFLNAEQMAHWASQPYFLDRDTRFIGPLESAATLGLMRTFRVYKTVAAYAGFLELQHYGSRYLEKIRVLEPGETKTPHE